MPTVLIPSDERDDIPNWVEGYSACGWEVVTGTHNFKLRAAKFDLLHHQWPEELSGWRVPGPAQLAEIKALLAWWQARTKCIFTVNNLHPHGFQGNAAYRELYSEVIRKCHLITHYTEASWRLLCDEYPEARDAKHLVHSPFNYERLLPLQHARGSRRSDLGIPEKDFVVLIFGALRSWEEICLIRSGFDRARIPHKRLLMAGKCNVGGIGRTRWQRRWRQFVWEQWLRRRGAIVHTEYIPEDGLFRFFDSSDTVLVPRIRSLNSALPAIGMTFGRAIVAPSHGSYPDVLAGTGNLLYESGDPDSLARALERMAALDSGAIGSSNAQLAAGWTWKQLVQSCLSAADGIQLADKPVPVPVDSRQSDTQP